ncbi:hypothetical protein H0I23_00815 [Cellulophaga sp. HaHaR_3_176]|uniref:hypothetical protein n=1 Tax=Cellulophaga sp. HaHaR_3_176 TaxID=1942464 RepID=UPI001C1F585E|nr:hypothetical protein [Cellulophaga sp. HaHaR_3_176]QWX84224.1 hypothetical protein H0I23_00815 [Cellulophaga sp. HaHaR_3_176]
MRHSYIIFGLLILLISCKYKNETNVPQSKVRSMGTSDISLQFRFDTVNKEELKLPLGYSKITLLKSVKNLNYDCYKGALDNTVLTITNFGFKDNISSHKFFNQLIEESKDSLNIALSNNYYANLKERSYFISSSYIQKGNLKIFFLKTVYSRVYDNKKGIENIYLISSKDGNVIDICNIYYHAVRTHSMESRFFHLSKNWNVSTAIYTNIEGDISIRGINKFKIDDNGYFSKLN